MIMERAGSGRCQPSPDMRTKPDIPVALVGQTLTNGLTRPAERSCRLLRAPDPDALIARKSVTVITARSHPGSVKYPKGRFDNSKKPPALAAHGGKVAVRAAAGRVRLPGVTGQCLDGLGGAGHRRLIGRVAAHYAGDRRVRAIVVFGSVGAGTWHELSDVDLDIVIADGAVAQPEREVAALFGTRAVIVLAGADSADVVLDSLEEVSIRWHALADTSPNIGATARVVAGGIGQALLAAAGDANRVPPDEERLLDAVIRDVIGARKFLVRGRRWEAVAAIERMRGRLTQLRGRRDGLRLDPADPAGALAAVLAEIQAGRDLGPRRRALLHRLEAEL
jgi:nucleotidyltransferase-like protein